MNKEEYLHELEIRLKKHLSKSEVADIISDYSEYFEDGRRQNKSDTEISAKLGEPEMIARQFIEEAAEGGKAGRMQESYAAKEIAKSKIEKMRKEAKKLPSLVGFFKGIFTMTTSVTAVIGFFIKAIVAFCLLMMGGAGVFLLLCIMAAVLGLSVSIVILGGVTLFLAMTTASFISFYVTLAGVFAAVMLLSGGILAITFICATIGKGCRFLMKAVTKLFDRKVIGEGPANA